jgi:hypothetical protein
VEVLTAVFDGSVRFMVATQALIGDEAISEGIGMIRMMGLYFLDRLKPWGLRSGK